MSHWDFPATDPIDLDAEITSGSVTISARPTDTITVDVQSTRRSGTDLADEVRVEYANGRLQISEPPQRHSWIRFSSGLDVVVTLPVGSRCSVRTVSADVLAEGELGSLSARITSGEISAGTVTGDVKISSTSGRVSVEDAAGPVSVKSASGSIDLGRVGGDLDVNSVSGRVEVGKAAASVSIRTASGRVKIGSLSRGQADITTVSGVIDLYVAKGVGVYLDMSSVSGRVTSDLEPSEASDQVDLHLRCRSVSGAVRVARTELADVS